MSKRQKPSILLETKRSFYLPYSWNPWQADSRNYYLQNLLARMTDLNFWTVYHEKGVTIHDDSAVALFQISEVSLEAEHEWINYNRLNTTAFGVLKLANERCCEVDQ